MVSNRSANTLPAPVLAQMSPSNSPVAAAQLVLPTTAGQQAAFLQLSTPIADAENMNTEESKATNNTNNSD